MDEEMEDAFGEGFLAMEIDLDYEFDASRYFDFSRNETPSEVREAEAWFESAGSYPPSPFVANFNSSEEILMESINISPKSQNVESSYSVTNDSDIGVDPQSSALDENKRVHEGMGGGVFINLSTGNMQNVQKEKQALTTGLVLHNQMAKDHPKAKPKSTIKTAFPRASTLMKPTASQLAKQKQPRDLCGSRRFFERSRKPFVQDSGRILVNPSGVESQAAKRQKLEGGHLCKVAETKQQTILTHKLPKRDGPVDGNLAHAKLKLTIPRGPNLETTHRVQRTRPENGTGLGEHVDPTAQKFKAHPLNRKILEAPSLPLPQKSTPRLPKFQEFHLKTSERAMQHSFSASSSSLPCNRTDKKANTSSITQNATTDSKRSNSVDALKPEYEIAHKFKARPQKTKEYIFSTDKRLQHHPPIELLKKLSLTSELQQNIVYQPKLPRPTP